MTWDEFYLGLADKVASKSKDPSTKVGCILVRPDRTVASLGFNGFPRGMEDTEERYKDRDEKLERTIHAEENAVLNSRESVKGYTAYVTHHPCTHCACILIQSGICEVVFPKPSEEMCQRWGKKFVKAKDFLLEAGIEVVEVDVG